MKNLVIAVFTLCSSLLHAQEDITASKMEGCSPLTVTFSCALENIKTCQWNFGNESTSTILNPVALYDTTGSYHVELVVTYTNNQVDTLILAEPILVADKPSANFNISGSEF